MEFLYDQSGRPYAFVLNNVTYYYVLNLQGDIVRLVNTAGTTVVSYVYNAWGKILSTQTTSLSYSATVAAKNPLRYRGYYYDTDTQLYYCQSRYYDPAIGRFINADALTSTGQGIIGNNMFAYCNNNPVNMSDTKGNWPEWVETTAKVASGLLVGVAVVGTVAAITSLTAGTGTALAVYGWSVLLGASLSGINGGVANAAQGNSYANGYAGGFLGGATQSSASALPYGNIWGGYLGAERGTRITMNLNNFDPDSANHSDLEIEKSATSSGIKAAAMGTITHWISYSVDYGVADGCGGLMPQLTYGFGEAIKTFFSWLDDAMVYAMG